MQRTHRLGRRGTIIVTDRVPAHFGPPAGLRGWRPLTRIDAARMIRDVRNATRIGEAIHNPL